VGRPYLRLGLRSQGDYIEWLEVMFNEKGKLKLEGKMSHGALALDVKRIWI
jgi:hypothetical protein